MRRFSQPIALSRWPTSNITPLLDLAFVLLIIFVITTPLLEQGLNLKLPAGGVEDRKKLDPRNIRTIDIGANGQYRMGGRDWTQAQLPQLVAGLKAEQARNPNLLVYIRGDRKGYYDYVASLLYRLEQAGITQVSLRTDPGAK
jgi:biopolymer transport protein ExbD/biopolymer transport protein TolR